MTYRKFRSIIDINSFREDLVKSTLINETSLELSSLSSQYHTVLSDILESHAPLQKRVIFVRPSSPWYSNDIAAEKKIRRKLERQWRHSQLTFHKQMNVNQCDRSVTVSRTSSTMLRYRGYFPTGRSVQRKTVPEVLKVLTEAEVSNFQDRGHSFSQYGPT